MKCPDCKKGELKLVTECCIVNDGIENDCELENPYYKCDVCKNEYQPEDVEE